MYVIPNNKVRIIVFFSYKFTEKAFNKITNLKFLS